MCRPSLRVKSFARKNIQMGFHVLTCLAKGWRRCVDDACHRPASSGNRPTEAERRNFLGGASKPNSVFRWPNSANDQAEPRRTAPHRKERSRPMSTPIQNASGFIRLSSILAPRGPIPVSKSTWWAGVKSGRYPQPVKLGPRITAWRVEDIRSLIEKPRA